MKLLITGSTGFVGRNLLLHALEDPSWSEIILPVRNQKKLLEQLQQDGIDEKNQHLHFCSVSNNQWNLTDVASLDTAIHCAGLTFSREQDLYFATNVQGAINLFQALPQTCRLLALSSQSAAGPCSKMIPTRMRKHLEQPISWYGESKLAMEKKLVAFAQDRLLILRPPMILGPRDTATAPLFKMVRGPLRLKPGLQKKEYSWIAVDDLCRALLVAAKNDWTRLSHRNYFVANSKIITDLELLETTAAVLGARGINVRLPHAMIQLISTVADRIPSLREALPSLGRDRVKEIFEQRWVIDGAEFERAFSWKATTSLAQALEQTAFWFKK